MDMSHSPSELSINPPGRQHAQPSRARPARRPVPQADCRAAAHDMYVARAGETINVPANAPHAFTNTAGTPEYKTELLPLARIAGRHPSVRIRPS